MPGDKHDKPWMLPLRPIGSGGIDLSTRDKIQKIQRRYKERENILRSVVAAILGVTPSSIAAMSFVFSADPSVLDEGSVADCTVIKLSEGGGDGGGTHKPA